MNVQVSNIMVDKLDARNPMSIAILAGGQSRRMGRDKALLRLGSRTLLEAVADRVRPLCDDLFVVATNQDAYEQLGLRVVPDLTPGSGSLGGVYTALGTARFDYCLVVACDMPLLNLKLLEYMASLPRDYDVLVPVLGSERSDQGVDRTYETLHAIYARSALPAIERRVRGGQLKIADLLGEVRLRLVDESTVRRFDPDLRSFYNANTPSEFASVERLSTGEPDDS